MPTRASKVAQTLKSAGGILGGKTVTPESADYSFSSARPATSHPWNAKYSPGDSSTGSAVAVAVDSAMGAMGTDTGGSIRGPSAMVGVVGLKPTFDLVSRSGVFPISASMDHCGPIAKTVEDAALLLAAIAD